MSARGLLSIPFLLKILGGHPFYPCVYCAVVEKACAALFLLEALQSRAGTGTPDFGIGCRKRRASRSRSSSTSLSRRGVCIQWAIVTSKAFAFLPLCCSLDEDSRLLVLLCISKVECSRISSSPLYWSYISLLPLNEMSVTLSNLRSTLVWTIPFFFCLTPTTQIQSVQRAAVVSLRRTLLMETSTTSRHPRLGK